MFILIGLLGVFGMTWLFPLLAAALKSRDQEPDLEPGENGRTSFVIGIPVHNDAERLELTLNSIEASLYFAGEESRGRIVVAADGCSDETAETARRHGAEVLELQPQQGKWKALSAIAQAANNVDWVVLADAGVLWPPILIKRIRRLFSNPAVAGAAPAYCNPAGGAVEMVHWQLEKHLKSLENMAGGPVSVHGATVAYRLTILKAALQRLSGRDWRNDDVVIPLAVRAENAGKKLVYLPDVCVSEQPGQADPRKEGRRRRRMAQGNIEWLPLLREVWRANPAAALVAARRVFRLLWAYWLLALAAGIWPLVFGAAPGAPSLAIIAALAAALTALRGWGLAAAARASLVSPFYLLFFRRNEVPWS